VTSVDPSGSEKGDATGIVTVARAHPIVRIPLDGEASVTSITTGMPVESGPIVVDRKSVALEDELTSWEPDSTWSPNRLDALVHGARYLMRMAGYAGAVGSATGLRTPVRRRR
jgi:phage terminase large subunit-like protein